MFGAEPSARSLSRQAAKAEKAGSTAEAILLYNQAAARGSLSALAKSRELTSRIAGSAPVPAAVQAAVVPVPDVDMSEYDRITDRDLREARELLPPPELALPPNSFTVDFREDPRKLWESVSRLLGLEVAFDDDYPQSGQPVRFRTAEQSARQLLHGVSSATSSFVVPLSPRRILIVKDTTQKRQEREPTVAVVLTLPDPTTVQELQEAARVVQQVMEIQKFAIDNSHRMVLMRDRLSKVRPAQHLFEQLLGAKPTVAIEVELFEVRNASSRTVGIGLPTSVRLYWLTNLFNNDPNSIQSDSPLATFGAGNGLIGLTLADATVTATALKTWGRSRQRAFIQSVNAQPAQLLIGEKYPIVTATYLGDTGGAPGQVFIPPPSFQFENLGITLKVTPFVHDEEEMTVEVDAEFKLLTGAEINGLPILANRKFNSRVRLRNGQWAVLAGIDQDAYSRNESGLPALMQIPGIGPLFRTTTVDTDQGGALLVIKPRLLGLPPGSMETRSLFLGPEGRPAMPL